MRDNPASRNESQSIATDEQELKTQQPTARLENAPIPTQLDHPKHQATLIQKDTDDQTASMVQPMTDKAVDTDKPAIAKISKTNEMNETSEIVKLPSQIKLTGRLLNFTRLSLHGNQVDELLEKVKIKLGQQRQSNLPVVVSCDHELDLISLWQGLWALGLQPIGMVTGVLDEQAKQHNIAIFPADGQRLDGKSSKPTAKQDKQDVLTPATPTATPAVISPNPPMIEVANEQVLSDKQLTDEKLSTDNSQISHLEGDLIHNQILRSGQSINHVGGDVILTKGINAGAEAITDYSLHVYGKAEGRLVAGATGDKNAKIFCLKFNPSLVSVAGTYCLKENIPSEYINQAVQVSYEDGQGLVFTLIA